MSRTRHVFEKVFALAIAVVGIAIRPDAATAAADSPRVEAGAGAPTAVRPVASIWLRIDGANNNERVYVSDGATWEAVPFDAGDDAFDDTGNYFATDTIKAAFAALATQIGGATATTYNFTNGTGSKLADNDAVYAALNKLDQAFVALLSIANGAGASMVGVEDTATFFAGANLEVALAELAIALGGTNSTTRNYSTNNYVADNDSLVIAVGKLDAGAKAAQDQADLASETLLPMAVLGAWGIDVDGAETNGGGLVGSTPTLTEAALGQAVVEDGGVFASLGGGPNAGYTSNWQLFPDVPVANDAIYFGASLKFCEIAIAMSATVQASTGAAFTWEYWNGAAWVPLTLARDGTSAAASNGSRAFERDGAIHFVPPADWAQSTVNGGTLFWVRCIVVTAANMGVALGLTDGKSHEIVTPNGGWVSRHTGTITTLRLADGAATLHTTADVKFILMNYTTGAHSGELTFAQDRRTQRWTGLTLAIAAGDVLGVLVTQEDTGAEPSGVMLELGITIT